MRFSPFILFLLLLCSVSLRAEDQGIIVRQSTVYADATAASAIVARVDAGVHVNIFGRKGGWTEIFSEEKGIIGWVRVYQVRQGEVAEAPVSEQQEDSRGFLAGLASFSRKASGFFRQESGATSAGTATIGVRGLSESEIESAQADFGELDKLESYASNANRLRDFTRAGKLKASKVPHVSGPK